MQLTMGLWVPQNLAVGWAALTRQLAARDHPDLFCGQRAEHRLTWHETGFRSRRNMLRPVCGGLRIEALENALLWSITSNRQWTGSSNSGQFQDKIPTTYRGQDSSRWVAFPCRVGAETFWQTCSVPRETFARTRFYLSGSSRINICWPNHGRHYGPFSSVVGH
jgi:hypothetical protein